MKLPKIFGLPPGGAMINPIIEASMPIAKISPQFPTFKTGLNLFTLKSAWSEGSETHPSYTQMLSDLGFEPSGDSIFIAFQADNFPTDSFTNEYGQSFLEKMTSMTSGMGDVAQMFGAGSMGEITKGLGDTLSQAGMETMGNFVTGAGDKAKQITKSIESGKYTGFAGRMLGTVSKMMAGARVDFPQVWKGSGFQPSYSMTIRLFNPDPSDMAATKKYIIGPIAALMLLAVPISTDGNVYNWPYLHKIKCPGIYNLNPAFISNITIVKGGDQQQIAFNQRLGIVDVRLDFGSLYSTMISTKGGKLSDRPTVKSYIDAMKMEKLVSKNEIKEPDNTTTESSGDASTPSVYPNVIGTTSPIITSTVRVESDITSITEELSGYFS